MPAAIDTSFDLAFWFCDRALNDSEYLQPVKLQYLMFLSQAYYASAFDGKKFIPAIFVAEKGGPIEPSIFYAWSAGRPKFEAKVKLSDQAEEFADSIWRRFGHHSVEYLAKLITKVPAYRKALKRGRRAEVRIDDIIESFDRTENAPSVKQIVKPKIMKSHRGHPVEVRNWSPPEVNSQKILSSKKTVEPG